MAAFGFGIPLIVGNLGAKAIQARARGRPLEREPLYDALARWADRGATSVEDYVGWNVVEPAEGEVDVSFHLEHLEAARRANLSYSIYPWLHAAPAWAWEKGLLEAARCVEHDVAGPTPSIFAPSTLAAFERFYDLLTRELGDGVARVTIAVPNDYGEVGYPTGMGQWVLEEEPIRSHVHRGFWCGDPHARAAFRSFVLDEHGDAATADRRYGTSFGRDDAIAPPPNPADPAWTDRFRDEFVPWYRGALLGFVDRLVAAAASRFPRATHAVKCGYGGELAAYGQDYAGVARLAKRRGLELWSTHGTLPVLFHKRLQTLCRAFEVPYVTEGVTERSAEQVRERLFEDASDGAAAFFEFHDTLDAFEDEFAEHARHLRGEPPEVDVALLFRTTMQDRRPDQSLPPRLLALSEPLRDLIDYAVVDEPLLTEPAALDPYSVLALPDPGPVRTATLDAIAGFCERGGLLVLPTRTDPDDATQSDADGLAAILCGPDRLATPADELIGFEATARPRLILPFGLDDTWFRVGRWNGVDEARHWFGADERPLRWFEETEEPCRWTADDAGFRLPCGEGAATLIVELYAPPSADPPSWRLSVDGAERDVRLSGGAERVAVPVTGRGGALTVRLRGPTFRPSDDAAGGDARSLGLIVRRAELVREPDEGTVAVRARARFLEPRVLGDALERLALRRVGRGGVVLVPPKDLPALAAATVAASAARSRLLPGTADHPHPDGRLDGVRTTRLPGRLLLRNDTPRYFRKPCRVRDGTVRTFVLPPHGIHAVDDPS